jgi:hypothetical protein
MLHSGVCLNVRAHMKYMHGFMGAKFLRKTLFKREVARKSNWLQGPHSLFIKSCSPSIDSPISHIFHALPALFIFFPAFSSAVSSSYMH